MFILSRQAKWQTDDPVEKMDIKDQKTIRSRLQFEKMKSKMIDGRFYCQGNSEKDSSFFKISWRLKEKNLFSFKLDFFAVFRKFWRFATALIDRT